MIIKNYGIFSTATLSILLFAGSKASGEEQLKQQDKSAYNLFNPTPESLMRELNTDRPDKTESPFTVDAGHFQIESDLFTYSHSHDTKAGADTRVDSWSFATLNLKAGLLDNADLQLVLNPYNRVKTDDRVTPLKTRQSGFGDIETRLKINFWGNDGGATAFGAMPFVKFPTSQDGLGNKSVEGGLILPVAVELPASWGMGAMTEIDWNLDGTGNGHHPEFINSITFDHQIVGKLGGYAEFFSQVSTERGSDWVGTFDLGLEYELTKNIQFDAGVNLGVTSSADEVNPFAGFSIRF